MTGIPPCITSPARSAHGELLAIVGPNGAGKSTLLKGIIGELKPLGGSLDLDGLTKSDIAYLPQQIEIDRSFPISVFDCVAMGLWRKIGAWRGLDAERDSRGHPRARHGRAAGSRRPSGRRAVGRPVPARAVRAPAAARRLADPARRAVPRRRHQDHRRSHRADPALARRGAHRARRVARHRAGARAFPADAAARARGGGLGRDAQSADARQSRQVAATGRGVRRACRDLRAGREPRASGSRHDRRRHPALHRVLLHAPGAGRLPRAVARRAADRRVPDAAAHEPDGRRHEPRHPARRGDRLSRCRAVAAGHVARRLRRRARRGACRGPRRAHHDPARGCEPCRLLSRVARARRADRLGQGQQYRPAACAVRHRARARRCGADPGRRRSPRVTLAVLAAIYRPLVLECFDPQFLRSASALELADAFHLPACWWCSIWWPASRRSAR